MVMYLEVAGSKIKFMVYVASITKMGITLQDIMKTEKEEVVELIFLVLGIE